jgi:AhpD family alkylhydroperoxidase
MLRVSQVNGCPSCVDRHASRALTRGIPAAKLAALAGHAASPLFDAREKAALAFAEAATGPGARVDPELQRELRSVFSPDAIVELTALVAFQDMSSRFNAALDAAPDGGCELPAPLPHREGEDR